MKDANKSRKMSLRDDFSEECISPDISHPEAMLQCTFFIFIVYSWN